MKIISAAAELRPAQSAARIGIFLAITLTVLALRTINPVSVSWFPFRTSCGAITGLPCVFCGTTRALHYLLNGDLSRALYFNWLSFPFALFAAMIGVKLALEIILQRRLTLGFPKIRFTPRLIAAGAVTLLALWFLQVSLAVSFHKRELLNPNGLLYGLVVR